MLRLALPNILNNVSVPLLSSVDTALMGGLSAGHLAAVGLSSMIFNFLYWNLGFLRMGTTGLTAQAFGASDAPEQSAILGRGAALALSLATMLLLAQYPLFAAASWLASVGVAQAPLVADYFFIRIWAAPASLLLYVVAGWLFGQQNARYPLYIAVGANAVNIAASYGLVVGAGWGIRGVAWGTVLAQYAGLGFGIGLLARHYGEHLSQAPRHVRSQFGAYRRLLRVNRDIFLRTLCLTLAFGFLFSRASADSVLALAVVTVLMQFLNWMSYAVDGFAYAAEAMVGKYLGARQPGNVRRAIRLCMVYGAGLAGLFALAYALAGEALIALFTDDVEVARLASRLSPYLVALPLVGTACYIWDGVLVGLTATRSMRDTMFLSLLLYVGSYLLLRPSLDTLPALWASLLVFLAVRGLLQTVWFARKGLSLR